jgi:hypothetical protein
MINFLELLIHNYANLRHILVNQKKGLSAIPEYIAASLDFDILDKLSLNGHGLSFPSHGVIQFRFIYEVQNIGKTYRIGQLPTPKGPGL